MIAALLPAAIIPEAMNWAEPAYRIMDIMAISAIVSPAVFSTTPAAKPMLKYPNSVGRQSFTPFRKLSSFCGAACGSSPAISSFIKNSLLLSINTNTIRAIFNTVNSPACFRPLLYLVPTNSPANEPILRGTVSEAIGSSHG
ncbi:hypothetical protein D3C81_1920520 [compost metagenome]